jgi:acetyl/propionyl-CoA carboxylase alpha subunit
MFTRIAVVDRGAAAMRLIRAVAEFNAEHETALRTIALHTAADAGACFVRQADEAVRIGPPGHGGADDPAWKPYLDCDELRRALREAGADAVWPGWGLLAERPGLAEVCTELGIVFIGPAAEVMRTLGDQIGARRLAERSGVPVAAWSGGTVETLAEARAQAGAIGYPLAVTPAAGGGGRGSHTVAGEAELGEAFQGAREEAARVVGDPAVFLQRVPRGARHLEVQVAADDAGGVWALGVADASLRRGSRAVIEESGSTLPGAGREQELRAAAVALARAAGYRNLGTVEFLHDPGEDLLTFLEFGPSLRGGHPVTELCTGVDLVKLALRLAAGERLDGEPPAAAGHAIAARLDARDPAGGVAAAPGRVELLALPSGPGVRADTGLDEGDLIPAGDHSMIAALAAWGRDRGEARARLVRALGETTVVIRGGATSKGVLLELLTGPDVRSGRPPPGLLEEIDGRAATRGAQVGLLVAAVSSYESAAARRRARLYESAARGRPHAPDELGHRAELRHHGQAYRLEVTQPAPGRYRVTVDETSIELGLERPRRFEARVWLGSGSVRVLCIPDPADYLVEVDGIAHRFSPGQGGLIRAPGPAMVMAINVAAGETVAAGDSLAAVESMKMELPITAPAAGRVAEVFVTRNTQVAAGTALLRLEPDSGHTTPGPPAERLGFAELAAPAASADEHARTLECLAALHSSVLGYDVAEAREVAEAYAELRRGQEADDPALLRAELDTLLCFADVCELSRNRQAGQPGEDGEEARSPREYLHAFLRSLDVEAEGLPAEFQHKLRRALAHYHLTDLHRSPALEEACYRIFCAQQRAHEQVPAMLAVLDRHLDAETLPETLADEFRAALDRVIEATQLRYPTLGEAARGVRYRCFDAPVLDRNRRAVFADMASELAYLAAHPQALDYPRRIERLLACPQLLIRLLADRR